MTDDRKTWDPLIDDDQVLYFTPDKITFGEYRRRNAEAAMDALVERVARAIHDVKGGLNYDYMDFCRDAARAAIAAMPEPGIPMYASKDATDEVLGK